MELDKLTAEYLNLIYTIFSLVAVINDGCVKELRKEKEKSNG